MKNICISLVVIICIIYISFKLYTSALRNAEYVGLATVPCQDYTLQTKQNYSLNIRITINHKKYPLDNNIGHDFGKCLHDIYTNDTSGKVFVTSNNKNIHTLGQFFDVWHVTFTTKQIFGYQTDITHQLKVFVNGRDAENYRSIPLYSNILIDIIYQ